MHDWIERRYYELYLILRIALQGFSKLGWHYLVQDKICRNNHGQTELFCQTIHQIQNNSTGALTRDLILGEAAKYNQYYYFVEFVPTFVWTLFVGSILDKNENATKWILYLQVFSSFVQDAVFLLNEYFFNLDTFYLLPAALMSGLSGSTPTLFTLSYRFLAITSLKKNRNLRLMMCQFSIAVGAASGVYGSGLLLRSPNLAQWHIGIRTYYVNFGTAIFTNILSIPLLILSFRRGDRMLPLVKKEEEEDKARERAEALEKNGESEVEVVNPEDHVENKNITSKGFFLEFFDTNNIKSMWTCLRRSRPHRINTSIYSIYLSYFLLYFVYLGKDSAELQFCEKVYNWSAKQFSTVGAIYRIVLTVDTFVCVIIFVRKLKVDDSKLISYSTLITSTAYFVVGVFLSEIVYFIAIPFMGMGALTFISLRNKLSSLVQTEEMGRLFSIVEMITSILPFLSSIVFTSLFSIFVSTIPGIVYQLSGLLYLLAFAVSIAEQWWCARGFWTGRRID